MLSQQQCCRRICLFSFIASTTILLRIKSTRRETQRCVCISTTRKKSNYRNFSSRTYEMKERFSIFLFFFLYSFPFFGFAQRFLFFFCGFFHHFFVSSFLLLFFYHFFCISFFVYLFFVVYYFKTIFYKKRRLFQLLLSL